MHRTEVTGGSAFHGGVVRYDRSGLTGVPPSATDITVDGHPAKEWAAGGITIGWTLKDGTGVTAAAEDEQAARDLASGVRAEDRVVTMGLEPGVTPSGWAVTQALVGDSGAGGTLFLCGPGGTTGNDRGCLTIEQFPSDTGRSPAMSGWRVAALGGEAVYVSATSPAVAIRDQSGAWIQISTDGPADLTVADLAAILLSIGH